MSAVDEYRKERLRRGPDVDGLTADAAIAELHAENERLELTLDAIEDAFVKERNIYPKMSISWCNWRNALKVMDAVVADIRSRDEAKKAEPRELTVMR